jgi:hypothetical protein
MFEIKRLDVLPQTPKRFDSNAEAFLKFAFAKIFFAAAYFIRLLIKWSFGAKEGQIIMFFQFPKTHYTPYNRLTIARFSTLSGVGRFKISLHQV